MPARERSTRKLWPLFPCELPVCVNLKSQNEGRLKHTHEASPEHSPNFGTRLCLPLAANRWDVQSSRGPEGRWAKQSPARKGWAIEGG
jgi:hypothetical protein